MSIYSDGVAYQQWCKEDQAASDFEDWCEHNQDRIEEAMKEAIVEFNDDNGRAPTEDEAQKMREEIEEKLYEKSNS